MANIQMEPTDVLAVNTTTAGTFVDLTYESQFEKDMATEEFTFLMTEDRFVLHRYNINPRTLVTR